MPMPIAAAATAVVKESLNHCCAAIPITAGSRHRRISLLQKKKCCASSWYDDSCIPGGVGIGHSQSEILSSMSCFIYLLSIVACPLISPHSAHPPGVVRGMVYGLVKTYHNQNSREQDYITILSLLHRRLVEQGWDAAFIKELIIWADSAVRLRITTDEPTPKPIPPPLVGELFQENTPRTRVFFHLEYYPADIPRRLGRICCIHIIQDITYHLIRVVIGIIK